LPDLNTADWRQCEHYLFGIDLFNARYWWECHEVLEGLWHAAGIGTPAAHVLQAVIQCAAAHLKAANDCPAGASRLHAHSVRHARWSGDRKLGLDLDEMVMNTRSFLAVENSTPAQLTLEF
jgi:predicted metal-dependent hydrolase